MEERLQKLNDPSKIRNVQDIKLKFYWYAVIASINQSLANALISYSTSIVSPHLGATLVCLNLVLSSVSGLLISNPVYRRLGFKTAKSVGMWGNAIVVTCLYIAIICHDINTAWTVAVIGGMIGGITSAIWWTSQAVFLQQICLKIAAEMGDATTTAPSTNNIENGDSGQKVSNTDTSKDIAIDPNQEHEGAVTVMDIVQNEMSGHWTVIYLSVDMCVFLTLSIIPIAADISMHAVFIILPILGVITSLLANTFESFDKHENLNPMTWDEYSKEIYAVSTQFNVDSRKTLLTFFFVEFAFAGVMFAGYLNDVVFSEKLGIRELGFLVAISDFCAVSSAFVFVYFSSKYSTGLNWVMQFGLCTFTVSGLLVLSLSEDTLGLWSITILLLALFGLGRGVFEGPSRAVYCKSFQGDELATAFAGQQLLLGVGGGLGILIFGFVSKEAIGSIVFIVGVIAIITYGLFMYVEDVKRKLPWGELRRIICQLTCTCGVIYNNKKLRKPLLDKDSNNNSNSNIVL